MLVRVFDSLMNDINSRSVWRVLSRLSVIGEERRFEGQRIGVCVCVCLGECMCVCVSGDWLE